MITNRGTPREACDQAQRPQRRADRRDGDNAPDAAPSSDALEQLVRISARYLRRHRGGPELPLDHLSRRRQRSPLLAQEMRDRLGQRDRLLARHDRDVRAEDAVQLEAAGIVSRDDGRAAGERFDGDGRQRFEHRGQDEEIRGGAVAGDGRVVDQPGEVDVAFDARAIVPTTFS